MVTRILAALLVCALCAPARADNDNRPAGSLGSEAPVDVVALPKPRREAEFIAIFTDARQRANAGRFADRAAGQIALEQRIAGFMRDGQDVHDWVGVVRDHGTTDKGLAWLSVEIAPDLILSTLRDLPQDQGYQTLIPTYSPIHRLLDKPLMGESVVFDASMLIFDIGSSDLIQHSQLIVRFWKLHRLNRPDQ